MIPCQRHLFEIPDAVAYFNCAFLSPQLHTVAAAGRAGIDRSASPWNVRAEHFFHESTIARGLFAKLVEAQPADIAILPSVSYGIAIAAANVKVGPAERIVVLAEQFPSNVYHWRELAQQMGAEVVTVDRPEDSDWTTALLATIDERAAVVAVPNVHWTDGSYVDLTRIGERCLAVNAALVVDSTQSLGASPLSVAAVRPAFLVSAAYKWLLGPYGLAFMYVDPAYQSGQPIEHNWLNRKDSEDFAGLVNYRDEFQAGASRFDVGESSNFILLPMAIAALEQILEWRVTDVSRSLAVMTEAIAERGLALDLMAAPVSQRANHMIGLRFPEGMPAGLMERLADEKVFVSARGSSMRISPHLYNNEHDIDRLFDVLSRARR